MRCFSNDAPNPLTKKTMRSQYVATQSKLRKLCAVPGIKKVHHVWECQFDDKIGNDNDLYLFVEMLDIEKPLNIRDALYGGRTGGTKMLVDVTESEDELRYSDFTSKYCSHTA